MLLEENDLGSHKLVKQPALLTERSESTLLPFALRIDILENSLEKYLGIIDRTHGGYA
jgi:hypothetical protein